MRITLPTLLSLLCLMGSIALTETALAKTYKWVDENGNTQYTATPPPTGDFKTIKAPAKPAVDPAKAQSDLDKRLEAFTKRKDDANKAQKEADEEATNNANKKSNCDQAKKNLTTIKTKVIVRKADGNILTEKERSDRIKTANDAIKKYCK
ncbi:MAG: DUF4124 domain-containing protein [Sulfuriflexus sp.]|nr:DUF4124 domain-containing protein [Sulfuriflexus sp.]